MSVKTTRRGFLSASAVLIAGASVIACSSRSTGTNPVSPTASSEQGVSPTAVPASTAAPTAAGAKPAGNTSPSGPAKVQIEVSIWGSWDSLYRKLSDNFEKQTPSVQVNITSAPQATYHDRLLTRFVAHDFPDMAMIVDFEFSRFETPAFLRDLTAYVKDVSEWDISDPGYKWFYPTPAKFFTKAGKIYAMPNEVNPIGLAYNADLFKEAGIPNPHEQWKQGTWTWNAFVETATKMTHGEGAAKVFGYTGAAEIWDLALRIWQNGGDIFNADKTQVIVDQPAAYEAIQWYFDLFLKYHVAPASLRSSDAAPMHYFPQGRVAMIEGSTWTRQSLKDANVHWGVAPQPKKVAYASWSGGSGYTITTGSKSPDAAWKYIRYAVSEEGARFLLRNGSPGSAVIKAMESPDFLYAPPDNADDFLAMLKTAHPQPFIDKNHEFQDLWNKQMDLVASGKKTAQQATVDIKREVEPLLKGS